MSKTPFKFTPKSLAALKGSIKKWEKIVAGTGIDKGSDNCPLCMMFIEQECKGCPVRHATGKIYCENTPYIDYCCSDGDGTLEAKAEVKFLKSLLPNGSKPI